MAIASLPKSNDLVTIIASAQAEGSAFTRMLTRRDRRTFTVPVDPRKTGWSEGTWLFQGDGGLFVGRIVSITDNGDPDDWITGEPTEWYVTFEKPWNQADTKTTIGNAKVEWLEDTLFPRSGRVISVDDSSNFMLGDIVRLG